MTVGGNDKPKKLLVLKVLEVLQKHSNKDNPKSQKEVLDEVEKEIDVDRRAISRCVKNLVIGDYIGCKEINRIRANGEEEVIYTDLYYKHKFSEPELRLLIDGLLSSKHIPYDHCKKLIMKLESLSSKYFTADTDNIRNIPLNMPKGADIFSNIKVLNLAIANGKQVEFIYNNFNEKGELVPRNDKKHVVNPYQMAATNGRYYLICNHADYTSISHYRIDKMTDIKVLDTYAKKRKYLTEKIILPTHMAEHIYMFSGESDYVRMRIDAELVNDVIDWFGKDVRFRDEMEGKKIATVKVNLKAMRYWAMQYANYVEILQPEGLRQEIREDLMNAVKKYK